MDEENSGVTSSTSSEDSDGTEETLENLVIPLEEPETPLKNVFDEEQYDVGEGSSEDEVLFHTEDISKDHSEENPKDEDEGTDCTEEVEIPEEEEEVLFPGEEEEEVVEENPKDEGTDYTEEVEIPEEEEEVLFPEEEEEEVVEEEIPEVAVQRISSPVPKDEDEEVYSLENEGESNLKFNSQGEELEEKQKSLEIEYLAPLEDNDGENTEVSESDPLGNLETVETKKEVSREDKKVKKIEKSKQVNTSPKRRKGKKKNFGGRRGGMNEKIYFQKCVEQTVTIQRQKDIIGQYRQEVLDLKKKVGRLQSSLEQNPGQQQQNRRTPVKKKRTKKKSSTPTITSPSSDRQNLIKRLQAEVDDLKSRLRMKDTVIWLLEKDVELFKHKSDPKNDTEAQSIKKQLGECLRKRKIDEKRINKMKRDKEAFTMRYRQLQCIVNNREDQIKRHSGIMTSQTKEIRRIREKLTELRGQNAIMRKRLKLVDVFNDL